MTIPGCKTQHFWFGIYLLHSSWLFPNIKVNHWAGTGTPSRTTSGMISTSRRPAMGELCRDSTGETIKPILILIVVSRKWNDCFFQRPPPWRQNPDCDLQCCSKHRVCGELEKLEVLTTFLSSNLILYPVLGWGHLLLISDCRIFHFQLPLTKNEGWN